MKRYLYLMFVAALFVTSCAKEEQTENLVKAPSIFASQENNPNTKTLLAVNEGVGTIYWQPAEDINVFFGTTSVKYTSTNTENVTTAAFETSTIIGSSEGSSTNIWGLYPYNSEAVCDGSKVTTTIPSTQYGVPETFDKNVFTTLAHSTTKELQFLNVCGGIKFSLSRADITKITFEGNNGETLAGKVDLTFVDNVPAATSVTAETKITLTPKTGSTFAKDVNYYIITLPVSMTGGFTMTFETATQIGTFNYTAKAVTVSRSKFSKKENIDTYATFSSNISFKDNIVKSICVSNWDTNGDGELSYEEAANVSSISDKFSGTSIVSFDELTYFTGISTIVDFQNCAQLKTIIIPQNVSTIWQGAFANCTSLKKIIIPQSVTKIKYNAFENCTSLEEIIIPNANAIISNDVFYGCSSLCSVTLPSSLLKIYTQTFAGCTKLENIEIPNTVNEIYPRAFENCELLNSLIIPDAVTIINKETFSGCSNLSQIQFGPITQIGEYAFKNCSSLQSFVLPSTLTKIGNFAFDGCSGLESFVIPNTVTTVGYAIFADCTSLQSIEIKCQISSLGASFFYHCEKLTSVELPGSLTSIQEGAFTACYELAELSIPSNVSSIGIYAFDSCTSLTNLYFYPTTAPSGYNSCLSSQKPSTGTIHYPQGANYQNWINAFGSGWVGVADL